jgi:hypothetical protein
LDTTVSAALIQKPHRTANIPCEHLLREGAPKPLRIHLWPAFHHALLKALRLRQQLLKTTTFPKLKTPFQHFHVQFGPRLTGGPLQQQVLHDGRRLQSDALERVALTHTAVQARFLFHKELARPTRRKLKVVFAEKDSIVINLRDYSHRFLTSFVSPHEGGGRSWSERRESVRGCSPVITIATIATIATTTTTTTTIIIVTQQK